MGLLIAVSSARQRSDPSLSSHRKDWARSPGLWPVASSHLPCDRCGRKLTRASSAFPLTRDSLRWPLQTVERHWSDRPPEKMPDQGSSGPRPIPVATPPPCEAWQSLVQAVHANSEADRVPYRQEQTRNPFV